MFALQNQKVPRAVVSTTFALLLVFALSSGPAAAAAATPTLTDETLVLALRGGGYNLYFRHVATDWSQHDDVRETGDWLSCDSSRMRQLSGAGREAATAIGKAIRSLGIPVGKVLASPYCRTLETARLMRLGPVEPSTAVMNLRSAEYFGGRAAIVATAQALLATPPETGTNTVIVAHGNVAQAATPAFPGEGDGLVFQPDGAGGFRYISQITPADWSRIIAKALD